MKNTNTTITPEAIKAATLEAIDLTASANSVRTMTATLKDARAEADRLAEAAHIAEAAYNDTTAEDEDGRRAALDEARTARAEATEAADRAEAIGATLAAVTADLDHLRHGDEVVVVWREQLDVDLAAARAADTLKAYARRLATLKAARKADPAAVTAEAIAEATAAVKAARAALNIAEAIAAEDPRHRAVYTATLGLRPDSLRPTAALSAAYRIAADVLTIMGGGAEAIADLAAATAANTAARRRRDEGVKALTTATTAEAAEAARAAIAEATEAGWAAEDTIRRASYAITRAAAASPLADYTVRALYTARTPATIEAAARAAAKIAAKNAVMREGSPAQWAIDEAARRGDWMHPDLADLAAAAADTIATAVTATPAARRREEHAATLMEAAAAHIAGAVDYARAAAVTRQAIAASRRYNGGAIDPRITSRGGVMLSHARAIRAALKAAAITDEADRAEAIAEAALMGIQAYTATLRHDTEAHLASLDTLADRAADIDEAADTTEAAPLAEVDALTRAAVMLYTEAAGGEYHRRRAYIAAALLPRLRDTLTKRQLTVLRALMRTAGGERGAARLVKVDKRTISRHREAIARTASAILDTIAPASIEAAGMRAFVGGDTAAEAAEAIARTTARRARAAAVTITPEAARAEGEAIAEGLTRASYIAEDTIAALPPAMAEAAALVLHGSTVKAAAEVLHRDRKTIREATARAADRIAAALRAGGYAPPEAATITTLRAYIAALED